MAPVDSTGRTSSRARPSSVPRSETRRGPRHPPQAGPGGGGARASPIPRLDVFLGPSARDGLPVDLDPLRRAEAFPFAGDGAAPIDGRAEHIEGERPDVAVLHRERAPLGTAPIVLGCLALIRRPTCHGQIASIRPHGPYRILDRPIPVNAMVLRSRPRHMLKTGRKGFAALVNRYLPASGGRA